MKTKHFVSLLVLVGSLVASAAPASAQKIYWAGSGTLKIYRANLDGTQVEGLVDTAFPAYGIALDQSRGKFYWTEYEGHAIRRANLDGSNVETVLLTGDPWAIAVDEINGHIYWSRGFDFGIQVRRVDLDGQNNQLILDTGNNLAAGIGLDVASGKIYLIFEFFFVMRANLDGSQPETVIPYSKDQWGYALAIDPLNRKVYWTAGEFQVMLFRANLDGSAVESLPFPVAHAWSVAVDPCRQRVYWVESEVADPGSERIGSAGFNGEDPSSFSAPIGSSLALALPYYRPNQEPKCIPALSPFGVFVLAAGMAFGAAVVLRRRTRGRPSLMILTTVILMGAEYAHATDLVAEIEIGTATLDIDSGAVSAGGQGNDPVVIFSHELEITDVSWLRLRFSDVFLAGSRASGNASFIRITGTQPGAVQTLDAVEVAQWGSTSAYFQGNSLLVELLSYSNTGTNRLVINEATFEESTVEGLPQGICGDSDDRALSWDPCVARLSFKKQSSNCGYVRFCTAFLVAGRPNVLLTAGHCCHAFPWCEIPVVEFNVPPSWGAPA
ncbi:MAG: hypothetical protein AAB341_01010, partial [Planctomycetota bacterium]